MTDEQTTRGFSQAYYSVDRRGFYRVGEELGLFVENPTSHALLPVRKDAEPQDLQNHLSIMFSAGLSLHGWSYMTCPGDFLQSNGQNYVPYETTLEIILEYVRRASFPDLPSRLQSYFAFSSLDEARKFSFKNDSKPIYRVVSGSVTRLDQRWLLLGRQGVTASYAAHQYWSGKSTSTPAWEHLLTAPMLVAECCS